VSFGIFVDLLQNISGQGDVDANGFWLAVQTAANIFDLVYKGEGGIVVSLARAERSPRAHDD
jgi:hypothetical protein